MTRKGCFRDNGKPETLAGKSGGLRNTIFFNFYTGVAQLKLTTAADAMCRAGCTLGRALLYIKYPHILRMQGYLTSAYSLGDNSLKS